MPLLVESGGKTRRSFFVCGCKYKASTSKKEEGSEAAKFVPVGEGSEAKPRVVNDSLNDCQSSSLHRKLL